MSEIHLVLEVRLSAFITAAVDESSPLSRQGVIELLRDYVRQGGVGWEGMIDQVRVEQVHVSEDEAAPSSDQLLEQGLIESDVIGAWA
jgi:hypothetical protein